MTVWCLVIKSPFRQLSRDLWVPMYIPQGTIRVKLFPSEEHQVPDNPGEGGHSGTRRHVGGRAEGGLHSVTMSRTPPGQGHVCPGMNQARPGKTADMRPGIST